jgi:hypothetical protein
MRVELVSSIGDLGEASVAPGLGGSEFIVGCKGMKWDSLEELKVEER